jgi:hypothetical protein
VFDWLQKGRLVGQQLKNGMPWQIVLSDQQLADLKAQIRRTTRSRKGAP